MGRLEKRNAQFRNLCRKPPNNAMNPCVANDLLLCAMKITPLGLWCWDIVTNIIILSDEIFEITGADPLLFDGNIEYITQNMIHPMHQNFFRESVENDLANSKIITREYRINNPLKDECWIRINGQLTVDENDSPIKYVGTVLDITKDYLSHKQLKNELSFFEAMIEALPNPIFYKDFLGLYRYCNTAFLNYLGLTEEQILNKSVYDISPKHLADIYYKADHDLMISQGSQVYEANVKYSDGSLHDVIFSKAAHVDAFQQTIGLVGIMQDITDKKAVENQVKMLHQVKDAFLEINHVIMSFENELGLLESLLIKLQAIFDVCEQCSVLEITDENYLKIVVSSGFDKEAAAHFSIPIAESFIWTDLNGVFKEAHIVNNIENYIANNATSIVATESSKRIQSTLIVPIRINNKVRWIFSFDSHINHAYTELHRVVANFIGEELPLLYRIFDLHQKNLQLSRYDGLTGLMTRSYFDYVFEDRLAVSQRHQYELLVVVFDLDGLKKINDYYGHLAGDHYITTFAALLKQSYRKSDMFSRVGGDEFVGLFSSTTAEALNQKICSMRNEFEIIKIQAELGLFNGSFSFGIAQFPNDSEDKSKLLQIADANMYKDKMRKK